ncbi:MAG: SpoIIE family protein phosphatase [Burkholderiaceae bacterium]|nr:SpoIIE family protein phosphatase [Burkholderiaceae bacterium]
MALNIGYAMLPLAGEPVCGDQGGWWQLPERRVLALADGLGHGRHAADAAAQAMQAVEAHLALDCEGIFSACDARLRGTRGAALVVAIIDLRCNTLSVAAIGNIRIILLSEGRQRRLGGGRGIVGAGYAALAPETLALRAGDVLALFSDGIDEFATLHDCLEGGVQAGAEQVLARWGNGRDDSSILCYQHDPNDRGGDDQRA